MNDKAKAAQARTRALRAEKQGRIGEAVQYRAEALRHDKRANMTEFGRLLDNSFAK